MIITVQNYRRTQTKHRKAKKGHGWTKLERWKDRVSNGLCDYYVDLSVLLLLLLFFCFLFAYLSVNTRAVIGQFSVPSSTVKHL